MGMVPASVARKIAARQRRCEWRYAILDQTGRLLVDGTTRHRPRLGGGRAAGKVAGGIVELHVPRTLLTDPSVTDQHPEWAGLLTDLAAQYELQKPIEQDATARFAGRRLRRRQQTRYPRCLFPGCRRPARDCDLDHRHDHAQGGLTDQANLAPGCRHDHRLKTTGGWRLVRRDQHTFVWISPLGRKHPVTVDPIAPPLPEPIPRQLPPHHEFADHADPGPTYRPLDQHGRPLTSTTTPSKPTAPIETDADPPPF